MKKGMIILVAALTIGLFGYQFADARPWGGGMMGGGCWDCDYWTCAQGSQPDEKTIQAREKFFAGTMELRKKLAVKEAEVTAMMNRENPDAQKVGQLTGEIFDLRMELRQKAMDSGLKPGSCGCGMGMGMGPHGRRGMMGKPGMMGGPIRGGSGPATE